MFLMESRGNLLGKKASPRTASKNFPGKCPAAAAAGHFPEVLGKRGTGRKALFQKGFLPALRMLQGAPMRQEGRGALLGADIMCSCIARAQRRAAPIARMTVAAPVTMSPPA